MEENEKKNSIEKDNRCFVIMPISDQGDYPKGHFDKVYEQIFKPAIEDAGFVPYRVDENRICDPIINKIFDAVQNCPMALCDLSNRNPNVLYELGLRQAYDKPVVLVQDEKTERIFDVSGINTVEYNSVRLFENVMAARARITDAIISTRDGRENSMVKVMQAGIASFSDTGMSKEDKLEIILNGIMRDIQDLKKCNLEKDNRWNKQLCYDDSEYIVTFEVPLKKGITNKEIARATEIVEKSLLPNAVIEYKKINDRLVVIARMKDYGLSQSERSVVKNYLIRRLS